MRGSGRLSPRKPVAVIYQRAFRFLPNKGVGEPFVLGEPKQQQADGNHNPLRAMDEMPEHVLSKKGPSTGTARYWWPLTTDNQF